MTTSRRAFLATLAAVLPFGGALVKMMSPKAPRSSPAGEPFNTPPELLFDYDEEVWRFGDAIPGDWTKISGTPGLGYHKVTSIRRDRDGSHVETVGLDGSARGWRVRA